MWHEDPIPDVQVAAGRCAGGPATREGRPAGVHFGPRPQRLHRPPVVRRLGLEDVLQDGLPRHRPTPDRLHRPPGGPRPGEGAPLLEPVLRGVTAAQEGETVPLLRAPTSAAESGLIGDKLTAAVDGTGLESRHTSRSFFKRASKKHSSRLWTKLTATVDTAH